MASKRIGFKPYGIVHSETQVKPQLVAVTSPPQAQRPEDVFARATVFFNNVGYCSLSEAVCATLLELFVPDFKIVVGETFQVAMGKGSSVDFLVNGVLFEYHGIRFHAERGRFGDFNSRQDYVNYLRRLRQYRGNRYKKQQLIAATHAQLVENYFTRRRRLIDQNEEHRRRELVVATCCDEFYDRIIRRFNHSFCPTRGEFRQIFYALVKVVSRQNQISRHQLNRDKIRA